MLSFPTDPTEGTQYTLGSKTWEWNGVAWDSLSISDAQVALAEAAAVTATTKAAEADTSADAAAASAVEASASAVGIAASLLSAINYFDGDGATVAFVLSANPGDEKHTRVHIDAAYQHKSSYSISGTTLTFTSAPPVGTSNIEVEIGPSSQVGAQVAAPASAIATGVAGTWATDGTYLYICSATNTWKRAAVATW